MIILSVQVWNVFIIHDILCSVDQKTIPENQTILWNWTTKSSYGWLPITLIAIALKKRQNILFFSLKRYDV